MIAIAEFSAPDAARVTATVYTFVVPLSAVTVIVAVCATPSAKALSVTGADTEALVSALVPVIVIEVTVFATLTVYAVVAAAKAGLNVPMLNVIPLKSAFVLLDVFSSGLGQASITSPISTITSPRIIRRIFHSSRFSFCRHRAAVREIPKLKE
ncbi:MAG: hypothetical protein WCT14_10505 [Treponemataceae bacterium]